MKAKFFFLGLCALALAACSLDEVKQVNDTNAIQFKATTATRATAVTTNNLTEFSVWAWNTDTYGVTNEFMDDVIATKSGSSFVTSPLYFWPTGTVDFYALVPSTEVKAANNDDLDREVYYLGGTLDPDHELTEDGTPWVYTGNVAQAHIDEGKIVIDTYVPSLAEEQIDLCYAVTKDQSSGSVPMNFRHALSQVAFKVTNSNPEFVVDIQEISLCSVYKEGTLTITDTTCTNLPTADLGIDEGLAQGTWVVTKEDADGQQVKGRFVPGITPTVLSGTADGTVDITTDPLMLIPQEVVGWDVYTDQYDEQLGSYIRILCNVQESGSQLWPNTVEEDYDAQADEDQDHPIHRVNGKEYAEIAVPIPDVEWEQGYRYTYTIIFGEGIGYYPPDDPNTDLDGTPILVPISFTVTVDEFQDADNSKGDYDVTTDTDVIVTTAKDLIAAWDRGLSPIEIAADITLDQDLWLNTGATMDIIIDEGCTLYINNIDDGYGYWDAFYVEDGTLNIYGDGAVKCTLTEDEGGTGFYAVWVYGGTVNIYGCTFQGYIDCVYAESGYANIYGGTFYGTDTYRDAYWLLNCYDSAYKGGTANIYVYGGTYYEFDPANCVCEGDGTNFCAEGYATVSYTDDNGTWYEVVSTTVATPADLKALVEAGVSEITVTEDITLSLDFPHLDFTSDCTLNLADGVVITPYVSVKGDGTSIMSDGVSSAAILVSGCALTVNAGEGAGIETDGASDKADTGVFIVDNGGVLVINSGTYKGANWDYDHSDSSTNTNPSETVYAYYGNVYIYGGTFYGGPSANYKSDGFKIQVGTTDCTENNINCKDSYRESKDSWFYVYGGTFRNEDPANNATEGSNTNYVVTGYTSTESGPDADGNYWFTVTEN